MALTPFLRSKVTNKGRCSHCNEPIKDNEDTAEMGSSGLQSLQVLADRRAGIDNTLFSQPSYAEFKLATTQLSGDHNDKIIVHKHCRIIFRTRLNRLEVDVPNLGTSTAEQVPEPTEQDESFPYRIRGISLKKRKLCFVCNTEAQDYVKPFNDGDLGRYSEENAVSKFKHSMDLNMKDEKHKYHSAAK